MQIAASVCVTQNASLFPKNEMFVTSEQCRGDIGTLTKTVGDEVSFNFSVRGTELANLRCTMNEIVSQADDRSLRCGGATMTEDDTAFINQNDKTWFWREIREVDPTLVRTSG